MYQQVDSLKEPLMLVKHSTELSLLIYRSLKIKEDPSSFPVEHHKIVEVFLLSDRSAMVKYSLCSNKEVLHWRVKGGDTTTYKLSNNNIVVNDIKTVKSKSRGPNSYVLLMHC